jgi:hypothetical protein
MGCLSTTISRNTYPRDAFTVQYFDLQTGFCFHCKIWNDENETPITNYFMILIDFTQFIANNAHALTLLEDHGAGQYDIHTSKRLVCWDSCTREPCRSQKTWNMLGGCEKRIFVSYNWLYTENPLQYCRLTNLQRSKGPLGNHHRPHLCKSMDAWLSLGNWSRVHQWDIPSAYSTNLYQIMGI